MMSSMGQEIHVCYNSIIELYITDYIENPAMYNAIMQKCNNAKAV